MPETKIGKCPWCERHKVMLTFVVGQYAGNIWCDWICYECLNSVMNMSEVMKIDDQRIRRQVSDPV